MAPNKTYDYCVPNILLALGNMQVLLVEKIEELTLYILELQSQIDELKK